VPVSNVITPAQFAIKPNSSLRQNISGAWLVFILGSGPDVQFSFDNEPAIDFLPGMSRKGGFKSISIASAGAIAACGIILVGVADQPMPTYPSLKDRTAFLQNMGDQACGAGNFYPAYPAATDAALTEAGPVVDPYAYEGYITIPADGNPLVLNDTGAYDTTGIKIQPGAAPFAYSLKVPMYVNNPNPTPQVFSTSYKRFR
jgi:hypothetical protein